VVRDFLAAINSGDAAAAAALLGPDATIFGRPVTSTNGGAAIAAFICAAEIVTIDAGRDELIVELDYTRTAPLAGSGACREGPAEQRHRVVVQDGLIAEFGEAGP
jgi:hypothetical protein